jgi:hypothetical protein
MFLFTFNKIEGGRPGPAAARTAAVRVPAVTTLDDLPSLPGLASLARAREYSDFRRASSMAAGPRLLQPALLLRARALPVQTAGSPSRTRRPWESDSESTPTRSRGAGPPTRSTPPQPRTGPAPSKPTREDCHDGRSPGRVCG